LAFRIARLHAKLLTAAAFGLIIVALPLPWHLPTRMLAGWNAGVLLYLVMTCVMMVRADEAGIRRRAAEQDEGGFIILALTIVATLASLVAIVFELGGAESARSESLAPALLAMATIVLSWSFVHTIFALHYAHDYYREGKNGTAGGLDFPQDKHPDYWDFLYFSLVIGMTSQVSDVPITRKSIRRMATAHGAISFFFNLTVLALTVNTISNLIKG
jgi:uncharacterized membrane protein